MNDTIKQFAAFFSPEINKAIADFRKTDTGRQLRNEYIRQELEAIANNPLVWILIIAVFFFAARR